MEALREGSSALNRLTRSWLQQGSGFQMVSRRRRGRISYTLYLRSTTMYRSTRKVYPVLTEPPASCQAEYPFQYTNVTTDFFCGVACSQRVNQRLGLHGLHRRFPGTALFPGSDRGCDIHIQSTAVWHPSRRQGAGGISPRRAVVHRHPVRQAVVTNCCCTV